MCVLGMGYIDLPTGLLFANNRANVVDVDINQRVVNTLKNGIISLKKKVFMNC